MKRLYYSLSSTENLGVGRRRRLLGALPTGRSLGDFASEAFPVVGTLTLVRGQADPVVLAGRPAYG